MSNQADDREHSRKIEQEAEERYLSRYVNSRAVPPLHRVAPCIDAMRAKVSVVRACIKYLESEGHATDMIVGLDALLMDINNGLSISTNVLRRELPKWR